MPSGEGGAVARSTTRRSPTRRTERGNATCERLRRTAACLFVTKGYDRVSLDEIVERAGGSKTNIYAFFGGKEGLFLASIELTCRDVLAPLAQASTEGHDLRAGLKLLGRALIDSLMDPRALGLHRTVIGETARFPALGAVWYNAGPGFSQGVVADFVQGRLHQHDDADELARLFHDMVAGDLLHRALFEAEPASDAERERVVDSATEAILSLIERSQPV